MSTIQISRVEGPSVTRPPNKDEKSGEGVDKERTSDSATPVKPETSSSYIPWIIGLASVAVGLLGYILSEQKVKSSLSGIGALGFGATLTSLVKRFQAKGEKAVGWLEGKGVWIFGLISAGLAAIPLYLTDDKFKGSLLPAGGAILGGLLGWIFEPIRHAVGLPTGKAVER